MKSYTHPLSQYILRQGITLKDISKQIGINTTALGRIVNGHTMPSLQTAVRINEITKGKVKIIDLYNAFYKANPQLKKGIRTRKSRVDDK